MSPSYAFPMCRARQSLSHHTRSYSTQDIFNQFNELYRPAHLGGGGGGGGSPMAESGAEGGASSPTAMFKSVSFPTDGGRAQSDK